MTKYGQQVRVLQCGHIFNERCYQTWKTSDANQHNTCPICRNELSPPQAPEDVTPLQSQASQESGSGSEE